MPAPIFASQLFLIYCNESLTDIRDHTKDHSNQIRIVVFMCTTFCLQYMPSNNNSVKLVPNVVHINATTLIWSLWLVWSLISVRDSLQYLINNPKDVQSWNRRFGTQTIHPTQKKYFYEFVANVLRDDIGIFIFDLHGGC